MQLMIKYKKIQEITEAVNYLIQNYQNNNKVNLEIDLNPIKI